MIVTESSSPCLCILSYRTSSYAEISPLPLPSSLLFSLFFLSPFLPFFPLPPCHHSSPTISSPQVNVLAVKRSIFRAREYAEGTEGSRGEKLKTCVVRWMSCCTVFKHATLSHNILYCAALYYAASYHTLLFDTFLLCLK
jgi:hypothetical protein